MMPFRLVLPELFLPAVALKEQQCKRATGLIDKSLVTKLTSGSNEFPIVFVGVVGSGDNF